MTLSLVWRAVICLWVGSEIVIGVATRAKKSSASVRDRGSLALVWVVIGISCFSAGWLSETQGPTMPISSHWAKGLGLAVLGTGLILRWTAIVTLGRYFTSNVAIQEGHTILKRGVYRYWRHPSYTGLWLAFVGLAIHFRNWWSLIIVIVPITTAMLYRIRVEEAALLETFGQDYEEYRKATGLLVPKIGP